MRLNLVALGVGALIVTAVAQDRPPAKLDAATEKMLIANERALFDAIARHDKAAFQALVAPDGIWATPTGFVPMNLLANGLDVFDVPKFGIENAHVIWTDGNAALLPYPRTGGGSFGGHPFASVMMASTLWTKRDGKWVAVYHQESTAEQ